MTDERTDPDIFDARVEELELAIEMAEGLRKDLHPVDTAAQRLHVLIEQLRQRINDVRHEQHQEATRGQPAPGSAHMGETSSNLGTRS